MSSVSRWLFVAVATSALASVACNPSPTSPEAAETDYGRSCGPEAKIEDGEDNNNQVIVQDGRSGYIYTYVDGTGSTISPAGGGVFSMTEGGANNTSYAMRMAGETSGAAIVYAGMGLNFTDPKDAYDASKYSGVSFFAKRGLKTTSKVRMKFPDINTDPDGGQCAACYNDFGTDVRLGEEWQRYIYKLTAVRQEPNWGSPRPGSVETSGLFAMQFQVKDQGTVFDVWVDEINFTGCGG